jgi:hypothetical protein
MPVPHRNQKGAGQGELGDAVRVLDQEGSIRGEDRFVGLHPSDDDSLVSA